MMPKKLRSKLADENRTRVIFGLDSESTLDEFKGRRGEGEEG
jgi:hypothetical protein